MKKYDFVSVKMVCRNFGRGFNSRQLHQILMYRSSVKSTKPAQHKLCGLFYVHCRLVKIAENHELWHPKWDPRQRVQKSVMTPTY